MATPYELERKNANNYLNVTREDIYRPVKPRGSYAEVNRDRQYVDPYPDRQDLDKLQASKNSSK